jgi:hypothetical protein
MKSKFFLLSIFFVLSSCYSEEPDPVYETPIETKVEVVTPKVIPSQKPVISVKNKDKEVIPTKTTKLKVPVVTKKNTNPNKVVKPTPTPTPVKPVSIEELSKTVYSKFLLKIKNLQSMKCNIRNFIKGNYFQKQYIPDAKSATSVMEIVFQRPRKMRARIKEAPASPTLLDTRLLYEGGENVKIKVPGVLGLFTFTFPVDKPELTGYRGYSIKDLDIVSLEARLDSPQAKVKLLGTSKVDGYDTYVIEVKNITYMDEKITNEIFNVKKSDYSLLSHEMFENDEMVFSNKYESFVYDAPTSDSDFKI